MDQKDDFLKISLRHYKPSSASGWPDWANFRLLGDFLHCPVFF
jgi:hypothetical protein